MATPMLKQYNEIKNKYKDCILFFRLGDFYEMFGDDAVEASKILNITLTARNKGTDNETPMCGIPHHASEGYISKLTKAGMKVAICEQTSDPSEKGIVERDVVRVVTPGTTLDNSILNSNENNYILGIDFDKKFGLSVLDLTTGEFKMTESNSLEDVKNEIEKINPSEILITKNINDTGLTELVKHFILEEKALPAFNSPEQILKDFFKVKSIESFGIQDFNIGINASCLVIEYIKETQKSQIDHIDKISVYSLNDTMVLDGTTIRNLELFYNLHDFTSKGSLLDVIDKTRTGMGGRLLRSFLMYPLIEVNKINQRNSAVKVLVEDFDLKEEMNEKLKKVSDIERLIGRIGCNRCSARDFISLKNTLEIIPEIHKYIKKYPELNFFISDISKLNDLYSLLNKSIDDDAPAVINMGGMIKEGFHDELDSYKGIMNSGKEYISKLQAQEIQKTGISSLKIKFNKVFGYYIEVSKTNLASIPSDYERRQTLVNAERFITPELKEYEEKVLVAEEKVKEIEYSIFQNIRERIVDYFEDLKSTARMIAHLDVFLSFANLAIYNNYSLPNITSEYEIEIKDGRHPIIEVMLQDENYISNDGKFDNTKNQLILLTGPNMSGKSSYLRQTALIVLLAQIGSYVPAKYAQIGIVDRIFTRVGASDNLSKGQSTFMVEMQEAANIINNATDKSLIILDELGRGTSTYDGVSIAWAIVEYIHNNIKAKTIFATHYHELIEFVDKLDYAQNYSISVKEENGGIVFLRKIVKGGINKSYGIQVAKLAGLPNTIIEKAFTTLAELETNQAVSERSGVTKTNIEIPYKIVDATKGIDINALTPLEAIKELDKIIKLIQNSSNE